jgi:hypothetical protein
LVPSKINFPMLSHSRLNLPGFAMSLFYHTRDKKATAQAGKSRASAYSKNNHK